MTYEPDKWQFLLLVRLFFYFAAKLPPVRLLEKRRTDI